MHHGSLARAHCACATLRKATRVVTRGYDEALAGTGLTITQFSAIRTLHRSGPMPLSRLADAMVMDRTSLYRLLKPLEERSLVAIASGAGRARIAELTGAGQATLAEAEPIWENLQARFVAALGEGEWTMLDDLLGRARAAMDQVAA